jgi:hypothetical protein
MVALLIAVTTAGQVNAGGFTHTGCSGAESPIVQAGIHDADLAHADCANVTEGETNDGESVGHEQTCGAQYGTTQWASLDCNYGSAAGCDVSSLLYCAGHFITAHAHCPPSQGGKNAGKLPQAGATRTAVGCSYHDTNGNIVGHTCSCTDNSGCS